MYNYFTKLEAAQWNSFTYATEGNCNGTRDKLKEKKRHCIQRKWENETEMERMRL